MSKRFLIVSASIGTGHNTAARALREAIDEISPASKVVYIDLLKISPVIVSLMYRDSYVWAANHCPYLWGYCFKKTDNFEAHRGSDGSGNLTWWKRLLFRRYLRLLEGSDYDEIICTHFLPCDLLAPLKRRGLLKARVSLVVTDYYMHAFWFSPGADRFYVACEQVRGQILGRGYGDEQIVVSGIPIDRRFWQRPKGDERIRLREKLGFDPKVPLLMILSGGWRSQDTRSLLCPLVKLANPLQILVAVGDDEQEMERVRSFEAPEHLNIRVYGWVENMHQLMGVSDLVITKTGGLTISEALAQGLAVAVFDPVPGQEESNAHFLLENGAAVYGENPSILAFKVDSLIRNPQQLERLRRNASSIGRPRAALTVIEDLVGSGSKNTPT